MLPWIPSPSSPTEQNSGPDALLDPAAFAERHTIWGMGFTIPNLIRPADVTSVWWHPPPKLDTGIQLLTQQPYIFLQACRTMAPCPPPPELALLIARTPCSPCVPSPATAFHYKCHLLSLAPSGPILPCSLKYLLPLTSAAF